MARAGSGITPCTSPLRLIERPLSATNTRRMSERRGERETLFCSSLSISLSLRSCYSTLSRRAVAALRGGLKRAPHSAMVIARWRGRKRKMLLRLHSLHHRYYVSPCRGRYSNATAIIMASPFRPATSSSSSLPLLCAAAAAIFHCRPPSEPKGEKERRPRDPVLVLPPSLLAVQYVNRLA